MDHLRAYWETRAGRRRLMLAAIRPPLTSEGKWRAYGIARRAAVAHARQLGVPYIVIINMKERPCES